VLKCAGRQDLLLQPCGSYPWFAMNVSAFLVRQLELKACRLHADTMHVHSAMVVLGVPLMTLMDVYERWAHVMPLQHFWLWEQVMLRSLCYSITLSAGENQVLLETQINIYELRFKLSFRLSANFGSNELNWN
jgi:hypothetical protein